MSQTSLTGAHAEKNRPSASSQGDAPRKSVKRPSPLVRILGFAGSRKPLFYLGCALVGISMALSMVPYLCLWRVVSDLISVAPDWSRAPQVMDYAWTAFAFAMIGILLYFIGLMCTHLVAFRVQSNITKECLNRLMRVPLGYFDSHSTGVLRRRVHTAAADMEQFIAHNMADIVGTAVMFVATVVLLFVFDWRMGLACLAAVIISISCMVSMMAGDSARFMKEYRDALDAMGKASTEYVRGIPVVKVFHQTASSLKAFKEAVDSFSDKAIHYQSAVCEKPQSLNLTFTEGAFVFLISVVALLAPGDLESGAIAGFVSDFAFYAIFSAVVSTALAKVMFAAGGMMQADDALGRIEDILEAPQISCSASPRKPADSSIAFEGVSFAYEGSDAPAVKNVSFFVPAGSTVALVGPSGGGKTTVASMIPRFWDADEGRILVGGQDVRAIDPRVLMDQVAFVFQSNRLFKASVFDNVSAARPSAARKEVMQALEAAQCADIIEKLPDGIDTVIGPDGTYLSGGEQQRVMIARAILKNAPIVVLDEATAFADPENEALIQRAFHELAADRTVVMIAHRLSAVVNVDKIVVLDKGQVVEQGTHGELVRAGGLYAHMWSDYQQAIQWKIAREVA